MKIILILIVIALLVILAIKVMQDAAANEVHALGGLRNIFSVLDKSLLDLGFSVHSITLRSVSYKKQHQNKVVVVELTKNLDLKNPYSLQSIIHVSGSVLRKSIYFDIEPKRTQKEYRETLKMQLTSVGIDINTSEKIVNKEESINIAKELQEINALIKSGRIISYKDTSNRLHKLSTYNKENKLQFKRDLFNTHLELVLLTKEYGKIDFLPYTYGNLDDVSGKESLSDWYKTSSVTWICVQKLLEIEKLDYAVKMIEPCVLATIHDEIAFKYKVENEKKVLYVFYLILISKFYLNENNTDSALYFINHAIKHFNELVETNTETNLFEAYIIRSEIYQKIGEVDKSLEDIEIYNQYKMANWMNNPDTFFNE